MSTPDWRYGQVVRATNGAEAMVVQMNDKRWSKYQVFVLRSGDDEFWTEGALRWTGPSGWEAIH